VPTAESRLTNRRFLLCPGNVRHVSVFIVHTPCHGDRRAPSAIRTQSPGDEQPVEKVFRTFFTDENLRFSRTLRVRDRIPAIQQAVFPQPASSPWKKSSGPFPRLKTCGFHGRCASAIASLRSSRLFFHSLLRRHATPR
jgi:hypothetical protein